MPWLEVRRTGNSLGLPIPRQIEREPGLSARDELVIRIERNPPWQSLDGKLKGRLTTDEFTQMSNEGEELA